MQGLFALHPKGLSNLGVCIHITLLTTQNVSYIKLLARQISHDQPEHLLELALQRYHK